MWSPAQREFLGISKKENALLKALNKGPLNTSEVAARASLPRITALRLLAVLWKRGFVARHKLAREVRWSLVNQKLLSKRLELDVGSERSILGRQIPLSDIASISLYKGAREMLASNQKILAAHPGERIYCIEPNAIWRHVSKIPPQDWVHLNRSLKQRRIIAEVIIEQGFEKFFKNHIDEMLSESFFAIAEDIQVMPAGLMPSAVETIIFRDQVLFLDWEQLIAVEIANAGTVKILKGLFVQLQQNSIPIKK